MGSVDVIRLLLLLKTMPELGSVGLYKLLNKLSNNIFSILNLSSDYLISLGLNSYQVNHVLKPDWNKIDRQFEIAKKNNINIISIFDKKYPANLKQIYDPPLLLFYKGNVDILSSELFSIVGTRKPTVYGRQIAEYFSSELLASGYIITSGFALGIDIASHLAVLKQKQPTVVVLGTSLDYIYPSQHKKYVDEIIDSGGVFISEALFTTPPLPSCFPKRNRIISGLSKGILVVEAARKSGSLITARCAMEQGREVFAIPGNINNHLAFGCLDLIKDGAKLTIDINDILEELTGCSSQVSLSHYSQADLLSNESTVELPHTLGKKAACDSLFSENRASLDHYIQASLSCGLHPRALNVGPRKKIIKKVEQVCNSRNKKVNNQLNKNLTNNQQLILNSIAGGVTEFDSIVNSLKLDTNEIMVQLMQLEIMGLVTNTAGGYVKL